MLWKLVPAFISNQHKSTKWWVFLVHFLASIGVPLALEAFKKMVGGSGGVPRIGKPPKVDGGAAPRMGKYQPPPPFYGTWEENSFSGGGKKKKSGKGLLLGKNSPFNGIPLLGTIL